MLTSKKFSLLFCYHLWWIKIIKRRRKKNPHSRNDTVEKTVADIKTRQYNKWDGTGHFTPGKDIGWQNSTAKIDVVQACFKDGKRTAASKGDALLYNWEEEPRKTTKGMDRENMKEDIDTRNIRTLTKQWPWCMTRIKRRRLLAASSSLSWWKREREREKER